MAKYVLKSSKDFLCTTDKIVENLYDDAWHSNIDTNTRTNSYPVIKSPNYHNNHKFKNNHVVTMGHPSTSVESVLARKLSLPQIISHTNTQLWGRYPSPHCM